MAKWMGVAAALALAMLLAVLTLVGFWDESCFEQLERLHLYGEIYDGEAKEVEETGC